MKLATILLTASTLFCFCANAARPDELLSDPKLETRAMAISDGLRCLVCNNQSLDDPDTNLAHDIRVLIRQRLQTGESDHQVSQYIVDHYGDYVLPKVKPQPKTYVLWLEPLLVVLFVACFSWISRRLQREGPKQHELPFSSTAKPE